MPRVCRHLTPTPTLSRRSAALLAAQDRLLRHRHEPCGASAGVVCSCSSAVCCGFKRGFAFLRPLVNRGGGAVQSHSLGAEQGGWLLLSLDEQSAVDTSVLRRCAHAAVLPLQA